MNSLEGSLLESPVNYCLRQEDQHSDFHLNFKKCQVHSWLLGYWA